MEKGETKQHALWSFLKLFLETSNLCKLTLLFTIVVGKKMYLQVSFT